MRARNELAALLTLTVVLLAVGCGVPSVDSPSGSQPGSSATVGGVPASPGLDAPEPATSGTPAASEMTGIDLLYLSMAAGHTEQTLQIVRLVHARLTDPELRILVAAIEATEADELTTMRAWLAQAGRSVRADDHAGHGTGPDQLARLRDAPADEVDQVLTEVLSAHQRGAADLARAQLTAGTDERVRDLARRIEQSRTAQVALLAARSAAS